MTVTSEGPLEFRMSDGILWVYINNPPNNLMNDAVFEAFGTLSDRLAAPEVRAVILTGKGRSFSKGADLKGLLENPDRLTEKFVMEANRHFSILEKLNKPMIAAINGACFGGGLELSLCCHIRVCSDRARIGLPELTAGVVPGLGGITRLIRVIGEARAVEMMLLGDLITAEQALAYGLVSRIIPSQVFESRVHDFARSIIAAHPETITALLDIVQQHRWVYEPGPIESAARAFAWLVKRTVVPIGG